MTTDLDLDLGIEASSTKPRYTPDEQAVAVWLSHTVILFTVPAIDVIGIGRFPAVFVSIEVLIWAVFAVLVPVYDVPARVLLSWIQRDEYLVDVEVLRRKALPAAFVLAFALQFVAITPLLADTGGPIRSPFAAFVVVYAVFSALLTTKLWALGVTLLVSTIYYTAMVAEYGFGHARELPTLGVYLAVTLLIIWLTVWLAFLSRLSAWRLQSSIDAEADLATLRAAVAAQIWDRPAVLTRWLPAGGAAAAAALAEYIQEHPELALRLVMNGRRLEWINPERTTAARKLKGAFSTPPAARLLATSLDLEDVRTVDDETSVGGTVLVGRLPSDPVLPESLVIRAVEAVPDSELLEETGRIARMEASARVAVLVVPDAGDWLSRPMTWTQQRSLATSIVIIDSDRLLRVVAASSPRRAFMSELREQADLTKANPFVDQGPTPMEMFYGRKPEETKVCALLRDSSAALLGGRRTGKTSLLRRIQRTLSAEGWIVLSADLQAVGDWKTFAELISPRWNVEVPFEFAPSSMEAVVRQIRDREGDGPMVIMFDEVDQFLYWDQQHGESYVREAFFRACRGLSQDGQAQFLLSGERMIAERLWSPESPHWNFCSPVPVRQLARDDADRLLARNLEHLEVNLADRERFLDLAWARTSGHPQIVQFLGKKLVSLLNERAPEDRGQLSVDDLASVTGRAEFREHYVATYQGQATPFEKAICDVVAHGAVTLRDLHSELIATNQDADLTAIPGAVRMLDLYGILDKADDELVFRARWMPELLREAELRIVSTTDQPHDG
jgi:hypothetical protein